MPLDDSFWRRRRVDHRTSSSGPPMQIICKGYPLLYVVSSFQLLFSVYPPLSVSCFPLCFCLSLSLSVCLSLCLSITDRVNSVSPRLGLSLSLFLRSSPRHFLIFLRVRNASDRTGKHWGSSCFDYICRSPGFGVWVEVRGCRL